MATHEIANQVPPVSGRDISTSAALFDGLAREGAGWAEVEVRELAALANTVETQQAGRLANEHPPVLHTHDRYGHRVDEVEYLPQYHQLMRTAVGHGLHGAPWVHERPGSHVARAAKVIAWGAADAGHLCPISMTYAVVPALRAAPELAAQYEPLLTNREYDPDLAAPQRKRGLIAGMSMTEKQGGSDVRANTTTAVATMDGSYRLTGHKWFTSAPMSDLFLTLAQTPAGLSCFLVPRVLPDGTRNAFALQRLKDKLGNRSNASGEVEYDNTLGWRVGEEGRGVATIIEMVNMTRLDCSLMAAGGMRLGVAQALHHATHRFAFGKPLVAQPAMANVLADLAVDSEAATTLVMRIAGAVDRSVRGDAGERAFRRLALSVTKYWLCKRLAPHTGEALECLGGNGYVEESGMPRLYREAPLVSIWEGSGNVAALDTLRAMAKQPEAVEAFFAELDLAAGTDARYDDALALLRKEFSDLDDLQYRARRVVERMALLLQGSLLLRLGDAAVADAFVASRLAGDWGGAYGTLPVGVDTAAILDRARLTPHERTLTQPRPWQGSAREGEDSLFAGLPTPDDHAVYPTLTYEVTGRIARIVFDRPEQGNTITPDTPLDLSHAVERADLDPRVHVIEVSGRGSGFCGGYDLGMFAEQGMPGAGATPHSDLSHDGTVLDPIVQARNHAPSRTWDPAVDYAFMSRFNRGFSSLLHANKPTVAKLHGFCIAGGADIALFADQIVVAADTKIGYPPARVWGIPAAGMWAHRVGDQRAKRLLFTGDSITGAEALAWGLAVEAPAPEDLDERTEILLERISRVPINQLVMTKLALNSVLLASGVATSGMFGTIFDGVARHTREGYSFVERAVEAGFRQAVHDRDEPFGDTGRTVFRG